MQAEQLKKKEKSHVKISQLLKVNEGLVNFLNTTTSCGSPSSLSPRTSPSTLSSGTPLSTLPSAKFPRRQDDCRLSANPYHPPPAAAAQDEEKEEEQDGEGEEEREEREDLS